MESEKDISMEQTILEASERLFLEKGFALTSTTEIAKAAGCNQALVHYYYRTKDKLFASVFKKKAMVFLKGFIQISDEPIPFAEKLKRKIESHFDMLSANPQIPFLFMNELLTNPSRVGAIREQLGELPFSIIAQFEKELAAEVAKGTIRPIALIDLILTVFSLNVMPFLIKPIIKEITGMSEADQRAFLQKRKQENVTTILRSLEMKA